MFSSDRRRVLERGEEGGALLVLGFLAVEEGSNMEELQEKRGRRELGGYILGELKGLGLG